MVVVRRRGKYIQKRVCSQTDRQTDTHTHTHKEAERERETHRHAHTQTQTHRHTDTDTHTLRHTDTNTHAQTHKVEVGLIYLHSQTERTLLPFTSEDCDPKVKKARRSNCEQ